MAEEMGIKVVGIVANAGILECNRQFVARIFSIDAAMKAGSIPWFWIHFRSFGSHNDIICRIHKDKVHRRRCPWYYVDNIPGFKGRGLVAMDRSYVDRNNVIFTDKDILKAISDYLK